MADAMTTCLILFLRMVLAAICGGVVGYERKSRGKGAGIRTHLVVAVGSALMMIISKYGFADFSQMLVGNVGEIKHDPARVAAQIVSGIGFLGAGMIYIHGKTTHGLTTAAGIWATAGIGMAIGSGMYFMGVLATLLLVGAQLLLHTNLKFLRMPKENKITVLFENNDEALAYIHKQLEERDIQIESMSLRKLENSLIRLEADVLSLQEMNSQDLLLFMHKSEYIKEISLNREAMGMR